MKSTAVHPALPSQAAVRRLGGGRAALRASAYLPLPERPGFDELAAAREALERVADRVAERLAELGVDPDRAAALVDRVAGAASEPRPGLPAARGYALLADPDAAHLFSLGIRPRAAVWVGRTHRVRPLLRAARLERSYRVLALSSKRVALYHGDRRGLRRVQAPGLPASEAAVLRAAAGDEAARRARAAGDDEHVRDEDRARFHRAVEGALRRRWSQRSDPLVLVADRSHQGRFRRHARLPGLLAEGVEGNPDRWPVPELHARTWPRVEAQLARQEEREAERARERLAHGRVFDRVGAAAAAAASGRVERLWVALEPTVHRHVDARTGKLVAPFGDEDALDEIAALVLRHGGDVRVAPEAAMPSASAVLAELRG